MDEARSRGDSTLALAPGKKNALRFATASVCLAFIFFWVQAWIGYRNIRAVLLVIALAMWLLLLIPWWKRDASLSRTSEQQGFYQALRIWAITDIAIVTAMTPIPYRLAPRRVPSCQCPREAACEWADASLTRGRARRSPILVRMLTWPPAELGIHRGTSLAVSGVNSRFRAQATDAHRDQP